jgi:uncharacterized protein (TIGR03083 family)
MKTPQPVIVTNLFPDVLDSLLDLLSTLSVDDWKRPTVCVRWSVKDIAAHLLGGKLGILSRKRDGYAFSGSAIIEWNDLVALINELNDIWIKAASRFSPPVLCELLSLSGEQVCAYFNTLDPYAIGDPVDWAGPEPAPVWLDVAREYTEWWHHQQQIRDAVDRPGLKQPRYFSPVLDTFARALPHTYRSIVAQEGVRIAVTISGDAGARWLLQQEDKAWKLYIGETEQADAELVIDQEIAWRLFTKGVSKQDALSAAEISGDRVLAMKALEMVSVIA